MPPLKQISRTAAGSPAHRSPLKSPDKSPDKTPEGTEQHVDPGPASAPPTPRDALRPPTNGTLAKMEQELEENVDGAGKAEGGEENRHAGSKCVKGLVNGDAVGKASVEDGERTDGEGSTPHRTEEAGTGNGDQGPESDVENDHRKEGVNTEPKVSALLFALWDIASSTRGQEVPESVVIPLEVD